VENEKLAFPMFNNQKGDCSRDDFIYESGMTLRDYFAGQALAGLLANTNLLEKLNTVKIPAMNAYALADAMLAEREAGL